MSHWLELDGSPDTVEIVTSSTCLLQRRDTGAVHLYGGEPGHWQLLDANPATAQIAAREVHLSVLSGTLRDLTVYQRHRGGSVFAQHRQLNTLPATEPPWVRLDANPATVDIVAGQQLYQRHADGSTWIYTGVPMTGWDRIDEGRPVAQLVATNDTFAASDDPVYRLDEDGRIAVRNGLAAGWRELDANPASAAIAAAGTTSATWLYQRHRDGRTFAWRDPGWQLLDDNPATAEIVAADDELFQRHADGSIWSYTGVPLTGWRKLDADPTAVQIAANRNGLYKRCADGSIHQYVE
jgi:hypothetical protein